MNEVDYREYLLDTIADGSVMMIRPREATTIKVVEYKYGFYAVAYTGDGSKSGSLRAAEFCCKTAEEAFTHINEKVAGQL